MYMQAYMDVFGSGRIATGSYKLHIQIQSKYPVAVICSFSYVCFGICVRSGCFAIMRATRLVCEMSSELGRDFRTPITVSMV